MATLTHAESRRMYSWWWDSHISPKNSKWLQENLTDMDAKVKTMIKLIEEDADSFARRAEMYYKKRPELMKLVEEFYRAYRALAERYDQATGALRQAHRTMAEAFPNQVPFVLTDDSPSGPSALETEPHTPDMAHPIRALLDPDDLQKEALGLSSSQFDTLNQNGLHTDESDSLASRKGLKKLNQLLDSGEGTLDHAKFAEGRVRKGLNFHEDDGELKENLSSSTDSNSQLSNENNNLKARDTRESGRAGNTDAEIQTLKEALARLEAEKEASLLQYQQSLERLSNLETQVSHAQEDARGLNEHMRKAENEVQTLKQSLAKLEAEKEAAILQYQQCLERISNLECKVSLAEKDAGGLNERASNAEAEVQNLKQALARLEAEKDAILVQYKQCLEIISNMETKIFHAEEDARGHKDRADRAEFEIQSLKQTIAKLKEEKEASRVQHQHSVETISQLETKVSSTQEEIKRLNSEIALGVAKLNSAEQQYLLSDRDNQSLQKEVEALVQKIEMQNRELLEKQSELERLRTLLQEESYRSVKAEAAFQALQELHSQSQEEQRALAVDLQKSVLMLKDMEHWSRGLEEEVHRVKDENKSLNEHNLSSAMSIKSMQDEIIRLKEMIMKLQQEVDLRLDQRNALQQEIYCLKEEINDLNRQHQGVITQVESVGLNLSNLGSSVKELQEKNVKLNEMHQKENDEKLALLRKLENMEKLLEKNALLENSLSDVNAELEGLREKVKELEESCHVLLSEKSTLSVERATIVSQLEIAAANMEKLSEKNSSLENSLSDTNVEIEGLKAKSKSLEESFQSLDKERAVLIDERETLVSHLKNFQVKLEELDKKYIELEDKYSGLEKEKEFTIHRVEELQSSLDLEKQEHGSFVQLTEIRLARLEEQIHLLQEESRWRKKEYEDEQDRAIKAQVEISILHMCILDLEEKNLFLLTECQKYFEKSKLSEELICELRQESLEQQAETKFLLNQIENLKMGIQQVSKVLKIAPESACQFQDEEDQQLIQHILQKIEDADRALLQMQDEKQETLLEKLILVTLLEQLRLEAADLESETNILDSKFKTQTEELLMLRSEKQKLEDMKEQLLLEVRTRVVREGILNEEIETLHAKLSDLQEAHLSMKGESKKLQEENRFLMEELSELEQEKCMLEEENNLIHGEVIALDHLSMFFKSFGAEKAMGVELIAEDVNNLHGLNSVLEEEAMKRREKLEMVEMENLELKQLVEKLESELKTGRNVMEQLNLELGLGKGILDQKEIELSEVELKLKASESENTELHRNIDDLKRDYEESKVEREELEKQMLELSEINTHQMIEICCLHDTNEKFESELANLHEEIGDHKIREENLSSALLETRNEVKLQEAEVTALYSELQLSAIFASLFEGKVHELFATCQKLGNENTFKSNEVEQLNYELGFGKDVLDQKEIELLEVEQKLEASESENTELHRNIDDLKRDYEESKVEREELEKQMLELLEINTHQTIEICCLHDANEKFESELANLHEEIGDHKIREENLSSALLETRNEVKLQEAEATALYSELQLSAIFASLFEGKVHELFATCQKLGNETTFKSKEVEQLNYELGLGKDMLDQKEIELLEVEQKLKASESENTELHRNIDDLKRDHEESKVEREELEKQMLELSEINTHQTIEICCLHDANEKFESELANLHEEVGDHKIREENLSSTLLETSNKVKLQEAEATSLYSELQLSAIFASLFEGKVHELFATCQKLGNETTFRSMEVEQLRERILALESENGGLKSELAACFLVLDSLRDSLTSLEDHVVSRTKTLIASNQETKDTALASQLHEKSCIEVAENQSQVVVADGVLGLLGLQSTVRAVEKAVIEMERVAMQESFVTNIKLEAAMKEIKELKSKSTSVGEEKLRDVAGNLKPLKTELEISKVRNGTVVKDIPLDQVSECSSFDHGIGSQGKNRRENPQMDDQMLELWEAATEQDCIVYHQINKAEQMAPAPTAEDPYHQIEPVEEQRSEYSSSELQAEKELGVDKLEVSRRFKETRQANKKKTLERLASDAQKLINLQITVEDLKKKVAISNKGIKGKGTAEYDELKGQLERIEEAITQLVDTNGKLTKNAEGSPSPSHGKAAEEIDESGKVRRRRVTEQARRGSEKIGRLQLEVQQVQFVLLKLEEESENKGSSTAKRSTKVLLRDYIYGGGRNGHRKKKTPCCACIRPTTKGD